MSTHTPSLEDPVVAGTSRIVGGRWGRHASGPSGWWWTPLRIAMGLTVLVLVLGYLQKAPCLTHGYTNDYQYTRLCYTDTYVLYTDEGLNARTTKKGTKKGTVIGTTSVPYRDHPVEYPPIIGGLMWTAAEVTSALHGGGADPSGSRGTTFFNVTALGLAVCALISTWTVAQIAGKRRAWDAMMVALSPALFMHAFTNWDLAAVAATGLGLWFWSRGSPWSPVWAGLMLGVGVATKLYPIFVVLAILMLCARATKWRAALMVAGGTIAGTVLSYLPAILVSKSFNYPADCHKDHHALSGWRWFLTLSQDRGTDWGSIWLVVQHVFSGDSLGHAMDTPSPVGKACVATPTSLNHVSEASVLILIAGVGLLVALAPRRPRVAQVAFLLVAGFVMLNKVDSPQYVLWILPLAVLARPKWGWLLLWQVTEVVLGAANLYQLIAQSSANGDEGLPFNTYLIVLVVRDVVLVWLMALVVREAIVPRADVVRNDGVDDPAGGVLDGAPDAGMVYAY